MSADTKPSHPARRATDHPVVSVVTPTYNEADNVGPLVDALNEALGDLPHEIIVVDDDSPDRTWEVAGAIADADPRVRVVRRFDNHGLSPAVMAGLGAARGEVLAVIDADLQHDEAILPEMVRRVRDGEADLVVGSRATDGGSYGEWGAGRRVVSWVATLIARLFLRVPTTDPMSGYFALSKATFDEMAPHINPQGFKILLEFIGRRRHRLRVAEVGFTFRNRVAGETKMSPSVIRSYLLAVVELWVGRQVKGQFVLYSLVGASGVVVNLVAFALVESLDFGAISVGFGRPLRWSLLVGIQVSIVWNFLLNNYFTFWERRFRGRSLVVGLVLFELVSALGVIVHVSVFQFLESTNWGDRALGEDAARIAHDGVGFLVALVSNYYLNVNYLWGRRNSV
ncbi:MAG: glycosyltransferase family 2 protein [Microthrixaceae bacterium]|nr:glycosyltransferase family 2 protein [Microthrixaceae bacterium]